MSIIFSDLVLLLLLLSLHACNARNLGVLHNHLPHDLKYHHPITKEKDENPSAGCVPMRPAGAERKISYREGKSDDGVIKGSDHLRKSWRVPHTKREDRDARFNLDYLPPKTHPPLHN